MDRTFAAPLPASQVPDSDTPPSPTAPQGPRPQVTPLQPGASAVAHIQRPSTHVAGPEGSCPQHARGLSPKQLGGDPLHATVPASRPPASRSRQSVPSHPGAIAPPHIQKPSTQTALPEGSCPQQLARSLPKQLGADSAHPAVASADASANPPVLLVLLLVARDVLVLTVVLLVLVVPVVPLAVEVTTALLVLVPSAVLELPVVVPVLALVVPEVAVPVTLAVAPALVRLIVPLLVVREPLVAAPMDRLVVDPAAPPLPMPALPPHPPTPAMSHTTGTAAPKGSRINLRYFIVYFQVMVRTQSGRSHLRREAFSIVQRQPSDMPTNMPTKGQHPGRLQRQTRLLQRSVE